MSIERQFYNIILVYTKTFTICNIFIDETSLNKYLTTQKLKEYAELSLENTKQKFKNRFKYDESAITMRGLLWNLADNRILIEEMLEPLGMRFPDSNKLLLPYDMVLSDTRI